MFGRWGHYLVRAPRVEKGALSVILVGFRHRRNSSLAVPDPSITSLTQIPSQFHFLCATSSTRSVGRSGKGEGGSLAYSGVVYFRFMRGSTIALAFPVLRAY